MRRTLPLAVLTLLATVSAPTVAQACSLAPATPKERVRGSDIAIYGTVVSIRSLDPPPAEGEVRRGGEDFEAKIRISRVYKGRTGPALRIRGNTEGAMCGIGELRTGQKLGLLLDRPGAPFAVDLADRISLADLRDATGGRWHRPGTR